jgi:hypothetical protein
MRALEYACHKFKDLLGSAKTVSIFVDNTSVQAGIRRGNARSADLAKALQRVVPQLRDLAARISVGYINTKDNPADPPSRVFPAQAYDEAARRALSAPTPADCEVAGLRWCKTQTSGKGNVSDLALWDRSWPKDTRSFASSPLRQSVTKNALNRSGVNG